ncbi:hypothetical protein NQ176_g5057 [Zarea fungicola]|uniref:Uncharacterized protein n=1 Tax=Zarea fungicola TaxID=93591 RepID=A0ACC1NBF9_9HYPO|nr:hypothetical protein NQ176_g5057 [Lecanicillium fungicola]
MISKTIVAAIVLAGSGSVFSAKLVARFADQYNPYQGDGSVAAGWPDQSDWGSYDQLWDANVPLMQQSCGWNNWGDNNSDDEISAINTAIQQVSGQSGVDARFILAIVMQESNGCVRVPTTNNGVRNPGLMQSHNGSGDCAGVSPCPSSEILQMIQDGVVGTADGPGLQGTIQQAVSDTGDSSVREFYAGARIYNSGSADYSNLDDGLGSTACYAEDVANRLTGWTLAASNCAA